MLSTIRTSIKTALESITEFAYVYDYMKVGVDGYPCVWFEPSRITDEEYDSCNNKIIYEFDIVIQQEIVNTPRGDAMDILIDTVEKVVQKFNSDRTLGGICTRIISGDTNFWEVIHDKWHLLFVTVSLRCETLSFNA